MLKHGRVSVAFIAILFLLLAADLMWDIPGWAYIVPAVIFVGVLIYGSAYIGSGYFMEVICYGDRNKNEIAITFDDGPVKGKTEIILDILEKNGVQAAFFCIGSRIAEEPALFRRIYEAGHIVANHSYSHHFFFDLYSTAETSRDLRATNETAGRILNRHLRLFRPPYGVTTPNIRRAVRRERLVTIGWSLRSMDTMAGMNGERMKEITRKAKGGDIVLFHDTAPMTVEHLQSFIGDVKQKGMKLVRLDKLLNIEPYA